MFYVISNGKEIKVGISDNPWSRKCRHHTYNPEKVFIAFAIAIRNEQQIETEIKRRLRDYRTPAENEWFRISVREVIGLVLELSMLQDTPEYLSLKFPTPEPLGMHPLFPAFFEKLLGYPTTSSHLEEGWNSWGEYFTDSIANGKTIEDLVAEDAVRRAEGFKKARSVLESLG